MKSILGQFTGNADVTDAKVFAVEVGSVHLDVDISDSLAAITAATSNGQLSAVLDAASSVTASNTSLADAVALSSDTHVAHSTVDFVQLAESARDNTSILRKNTLSQSALT